MTGIARIAIFAGLLVLGAGPVLAQQATEGQSLAPAADDAVLAQGAGGTLTYDGAEAYIDALEFIYGQLGQPTTFDAEQRAQIHGALAGGFADLPVEAQTDLANARPLWTEYRAAWDALPLEARQEFAYYVLALAYGGPAAAQALGLDTGGGAGAGGGSSPSVDDMIGNVPGTTDCWGSAGCTGYDPGSGTYTYESFD